MMNNNMNPMQLFQMFNNSQNPMGMMKQMLGDNPYMQQAMKMAEGKNPFEIKEIIQNVAQQKGIPMDQLTSMANMFGMKL